jgi:hypothetical protein
MNQDTKKHDFSIGLNAQVSTGELARLNLNGGIDKIIAGSAEGQSTILLKFDLSGNLVEKLEYRLTGHADKGLGPEMSAGESVTAISAISDENGNWNAVEKFAVYPNPVTSNNFKVTLATIKGLATVDLNIYNVAGQRVFAKKLDVVDNYVSEEVYMDKILPSGVYFIETLADTHKQVVKVLIE